MDKTNRYLDFCKVLEHCKSGSEEEFEIYKKMVEFLESEAATSVEFNYKDLNIGLEAEYSNAAYAYWENKKMISDYRVDNIRGVFRVCYNFSHTWNK